MGASEVDDRDDAPGRWSELLSRRYAPTTTVLAGGVALFATDVYLTTSLLPSVVAEIGGGRFYAWSTTLFLLTAVVASVTVSRVLAATGSRGAYGVALGLFLTGTVIDALAAAMPVFLAGRAIQGLGGGLLAGLGYALLRSDLPPRLWSRGSAVVSAMWGLGTMLGPSVGGLFAGLGLWRGAFWTMAAATVAVALLVPTALPRRAPATAREPVPVRSLILIAGATTAIGLAGTTSGVGAGLGWGAAGVLMLVVFVVHERRTDVGVLPPTVLRRDSPLRWIYLAVALLAAAMSPEIFVPLFGQQLAGLGPLAAGFLGAALAAGWTLSEIPSASAERATMIRRLVVAGPVVLACGLALCALLVPQSTPAAAVWALALLLAGAGVGLAWPHLAALGMRASTEPGEEDRVAATISTVQLTGSAVGAAVAGLLVNAAPEPGRPSAVWLFVGLAVLAAAAVLPAWRAGRAAVGSAPASAVAGD